MADNKKDKKKAPKTTKGEIILILVLAVILALCIGAFFTVPDIVKGKNPFEKLFEKKQVEEVIEEEPAEIEDGEEEFAIGVEGSVLEGYEENPDATENAMSQQVENQETSQEESVESQNPESNQE